jgi:hypothetical protein
VSATGTVGEVVPSAGCRPLGADVVEDVAGGAEPTVDAAAPVLRGALSTV